MRRSSTMTASDMSALRIARGGPRAPARVADQSRGGDVVVLRSALDQADRAVLARSTGVAAGQFTTRLRGLAQEQRLVRLTVEPARAKVG
jgi:hypothetical protein